MTSTFNRFREAQRTSHGGITTALNELRAGRKTSHWIWYVFPQLAILGRSETAKFYGIRDFAEACDYLHDAELRRNLESASTEVAHQLRRGTSLTSLMGGATDALKLVSSLTLFEAAASFLNGTSGPRLPLASSRKCFAEVLSLAEQQSFPRCVITAEVLAAVQTKERTGGAKSSTR